MDLFVLCVACLVNNSQQAPPSPNDLLLNVMEVLSVGGCALLDRPCMAFQTMCVLCL